MLHRRPGAPSSISSSSPTPPAPPSSLISGGTTNKAYTPLRRQSANLYPSNNGNRNVPRYSIPQASPLNLGGINSYSSSFGAGGLNSPSLDGQYNAGGGGEWTDGRYIGMRVRGVLEHLGMGVRDAVRLERSWELVWSDRELRTLVLKSTLINILSLISLSLGSLLFSPFLVHPVSELMESKTKKWGMWYNLLLSWPVFFVCFWINASWGPSISKRAQAILHPSHRFQPSPVSTPTSSTPSSSTTTSTPFAKVFQAITRILLISDFTLISRLIGLIPFFGRWASFGYMCVIDAYYCFEWNFTSKHWPLDHRIRYMQDRTAYMIGFGFAATFLTSFGPPLVTMAIFALIYPFFVLQAIQAKPPSPSSSSSNSSVLLPSTPSPHASLPPSPISGEMSLNDPFFANQPNPSSSHSTLRRRKGIEFRLPIFWLASYALEGVKWLEIAVARDRSGERTVNGNGYGYGYGLGLKGVGSLNGLSERKGKRLQ
ncbi:hypothetical protein I302_105811 [Kwoniella bestiolae CBS 10118]|uniref:Etoposide-induced protein 2.4-domain-containing protein n=1 Tax=Kwoniella bestiolae CBS 10118 TaxID=1296100 RepID=A0A1B9G268_9TREE|nr:hypothetical protein I302_04932 [Kwoniella bestiolae CBS 10118]OCF25122.1 hypothetical protein I302_04932 [Kwoniella bestiolae CBS 10118]